MKPDTISAISVSPTVLLLKVWWEGQLYLYHLEACWNYTRTPSQLDLQNQKLQFNKFPRRFVCISQFGKHCPITPTRICTKQKLNKYFETWGPGNPRVFSVLPSHLTLVQL